MSEPLPPSLFSPAGPLSLEAVKKAISEDLNTSVDIPSGHRGAVVTFLNQDKVEVAVATRIIGADGGHVTWDVGAVVSHPWSGGSTGFGVTNKITW